MEKDPLMASEADIQTAIVDVLLCHGFIVIRINSGMARGLRSDGVVRLAPPGTPDLLAIGPAGLLWWIETKSVLGRRRETQKKMHQELRDHGQFVYIMRSVDAIIALLREAGLCRIAE